MILSVDMFIAFLLKFKHLLFELRVKFYFNAVSGVDVGILKS